MVFLRFGGPREVRLNYSLLIRVAVSVGLTKEVCMAIRGNTIAIYVSRFGLAVTETLGW